MSVEHNKRFHEENKIRSCQGLCNEDKLKETISMKMFPWLTKINCLQTLKEFKCVVDCGPTKRCESMADAMDYCKVIVY